jgi:hypothetical protein
LNKRFPELEKARENFLGKEPERSPYKKIHTGEIKKFSEVVYNLAMQEEPHPARINFIQTQ